MPKSNSSSRYELDHDGNVVNGTAALCTNQELFLTQLFSQFGWTCTLLDKHGSRRHFSLKHGDSVSRDIIVYSGTVRDESRDPYEKKIQLGSAADPRVDDRTKTVILGIYIFEDADTYKDAVMVGFPISSAINYPSNPSLRGGVRVNDILLKAKLKGLYVDPNSKNVGFRPEFVYYYLDNYERFHYGEAGGESSVDDSSLIEEMEEPRQQISYGAPGTGKSFDADKFVKVYGVECVRTTFHPDSDYSTFVGSYKPMMKTDAYQSVVTSGTMEGNNISKKDVLVTNKKISYEFRPQAFMEAYVKAWKNMASPAANGKIKPVLLVIEEINRGNCAQIFGDVFQLLDRCDKGYSIYPVNADSDLAQWLHDDDQFGGSGLNITKPSGIEISNEDWFQIVIGRKLALPPNLYIWATMNTSDQSLFPIDSAFKRRWEWKYMPISRPSSEDFVSRKILVGDTEYDWWNFISIVNWYISDKTKSEDKQLGYFFVKAPDGTGIITAKQFVSKVLFFLYNDVFKDYDLPDDVFGTGENDEKFAFKDFFYAEASTVNGVAKKPGDIREDRVARFLKHLKHDGMTVAESHHEGTANSEEDTSHACEQTTVS